MWNIENTISREVVHDVIHTGFSSPVETRLVRVERIILIDAIENWLANWRHFAHHDNHGMHMPARMAVLKRKP